MSNDNKNYYILSEIITGLREEYIKKQVILKKMSELITVDTEDRISTRLYISQKINDDPNYYWNKPRLWLTVTKKPTVQELYRKSKKNSSFNSEMIEASYQLVEDENLHFDLFDHSKIEFYKKSKLNKSIYNPKIIVNNYESFKMLYEELKNNIIFNLSPKWINLNTYENISIDNEGIKLIVEDNERRKISINYIPDTIVISSDIKYTEEYINKLLETLVPKQLLSQDYITALEENKSKTRNIRLYNKIKDDDFSLNKKINNI